MMEWKLCPSAVTGIQLSAERGAYKEHNNGNMENIYLTAPQAFEWNETNKWRVAYFIESPQGETIEGTLKENYYDSEIQAITAVILHFEVDLSIRNFKEHGFKHI